MPRHPRYHHKKVTPAQMQEVIQALDVYINELDEPLVSEFVSSEPIALKYHVTMSDLYDWPELQPQVLLMRAKEQAYLLRMGLNGKAAAMSIFRLKQATHGFRDRVEQDVTTQGERITFVNTVPRVLEDKDKKK